MSGGPHRLLDFHPQACGSSLGDTDDSGCPGSAAAPVGAKVPGGDQEGEEELPGQEEPCQEETGRGLGDWEGWEEQVSGVSQQLQSPVVIFELELEINL